MPAATPVMAPEILDHVYSEALEAWYRRFAAERHLLGVERDALDEAVWKVYTRESTLDAFLREIEALFGTRERAQAIAIPILGNDFLAIQDELGVDVAAYIRAIGGDPAPYVRTVTADAVAEEIIMTAGGTAPQDPVARRRLALALVSFLTDARTRAQTLDALARAPKVGGAGLPPDAAESLVSAAEAKRAALRVARVTIRPAATPTPPSSFHLVKPVSSGLIQPEDEEEIASLRQAVLGDVLGDRLRAAVDRVIRRTGATFKHGDVARRFRTAIESRLRDIRDGRETLDLLTRPSVAGGFGIPKEQAEKVLRVVEGEVRELHAKPAAGQQGTEAQEQRRGGATSPPDDGRGARSIASARDGLRPAPTPAAPTETKRVAPTTAITPQLVHPVPPVQPSAASPKPQAPPPPVVKQIPIAPPPAKPQAASPKPQAPPLPPPKPVAEALPPKADKQASIDGGLKLAATPATPPASVIREHPSPIRASSVPSGKSKMQDIRSVPQRLVGPIEELAQLSVDDLRKIARSPADAVARILEKLARLGEDSYTKRADGVKALRGSPLFRTYAELVNAALIAKRKAEDLIAERMRVDQQSLTLDEFHAIRALNTQLRY